MPKVPAAALALAINMVLLGSPACQKQSAKPPGPSVSATNDSGTAPVSPASAGGDPGKRAVPPKPFTLTLSSGGGFSGIVQGCTLSSLGEAKGWQKRPGAPEAITWTKAVQADSVLALAKALEEFLSVHLEETGNMTTQIRYALPDSTYGWSISGAGASPQAPEPFRTWYARAEAYCRDPAAAP